MRPEIREAMAKIAVFEDPQMVFVVGAEANSCRRQTALVDVGPVVVE